MDEAHAWAVDVVGSDDGEGHGAMVAERFAVKFRKQVGVSDICGVGHADGCCFGCGDFDAVLEECARDDFAGGGEDEALQVFLSMCEVERGKRHRFVSAEDVVGFFEDVRDADDRGEVYDVGVVVGEVVERAVLEQVAFDDADVVVGGEFFEEGIVDRA